MPVLATPVALFYDVRRETSLIVLPVPSYDSCRGWGLLILKTLAFARAGMH
jgi:hypothetical protein